MSKLDILREGPRRVTLSRVVVLRGNGADTIAREVVQLYDDRGELVAELDPCAGPADDDANQLRQP